MKLLKKNRKLQPAGMERFHFSACVEDARFQLQAAYLPLIKTVEGIFVKEAIAKLPTSPDFEKIVETAEMMFGSRMCHFNVLLYTFTRLEAVAMQIHVAGEWTEFVKLADEFKLASFEDYREAALQKWKTGLLKIEINNKSDDMLVRPL
jgi:hypothetical protein